MNGKPDSTIKTIVLVHGGFVDGSGWEEVYKILKKDGYNVSIVQNPTISLADDVAVTKRVLATQSGVWHLCGQGRVGRHQPERPRGGSAARRTGWGSFADGAAGDARVSTRLGKGGAFRRSNGDCEGVLS